MNAVDVENGATHRGARRPLGGLGPRMGHQPRAAWGRCQMRTTERVLLSGVALQHDGNAEFHGPRGSAAGGTRGNVLILKRKRLFNFFPLYCRKNEILCHRNIYYSSLK